MSACKELSINPGDLFDKTVDDVTAELQHSMKKKQVPQDLVQIRYNHYHNRRQSKAKRN